MTSYQVRIDFSSMVSMSIYLPIYILMYYVGMKMYLLSMSTMCVYMHVLYKNVQKIIGLTSKILTKQVHYFFNLIAVSRTFQHLPCVHACIVPNKENSHI